MNVVLYALTTEKAVGGIEKENRLTFIVELNASKTDVRKELESKYGEKVYSINTLVTPDGRKKAIVKFKKPKAASEIATKLKLI